MPFLENTPLRKISRSVVITKLIPDQFTYRQARLSSVSKMPTPRTYTKMSGMPKAAATAVTTIAATTIAACGVMNHQCGRTSSSTSSLLFSSFGSNPTRQA